MTGNVHVFARTTRYLQLQAQLTLGGIRELFVPLEKDGLRLPPPRLRNRVAGTRDAEAFVNAGIGMKRRIISALRANDLELTSFRDVFDFGCGSGRLLRHFRDEAAFAAIHGSDIDAEAISWCRKHLRFAHTFVNGHEPPLPCGDASFDLIISVSIFTHLDEERQHQWLAELARVARPGALLMLTVQCQRLGPLSQQERDHFRKHGFVYFRSKSPDRRAIGLPEFYQAARHSREYIAREWSRYFEVIDQIPGPKLQQDIVVARKR